MITFLLISRTGRNSLSNLPYRFGTAIHVILAKLRFKTEGHNFVEFSLAAKIIKTCQIKKKSSGSYNLPRIKDNQDNLPRIKITPSGSQKASPGTSKDNDARKSSNLNGS